MMSFLITFLIMAVVIVIMSVGVLFGRKPVQGSCGGMNNIVGLKECEICAGEPCQNRFPDRKEELAPYRTPKPAGGILPGND
ncbi:MAG: (Na+)-NQR maturation NqrM [Gammaproteobacteria bacterium]|nr:(Na+)-NQR maturation NqrM [Gammaproteobacteria bacterium]